MKRKGAQKKRNAKRSLPPRQVQSDAVQASTASRDLESGERLIPDTRLGVDASSAADSSSAADARFVAEIRRTLLFAQVDLHSQSNFFCGYADDLSDGGLFVATYEPLSPGQPVHVKFRLPDGEQVSADGHVAWLRDPLHSDIDLAPGVGVVFDALDDAARRAALQFITCREPTFVDPD